MRAAVIAAVAALVLAAGSATAAREQTAADPGVFAGLGTWIDVYDGKLLASPEALAGRIAARGVRTVYVETANYKAVTDVVDAARLGRLVDALHLNGVRAVAWYLPGFQQPAKDIRRALAMLSLRTARGEAFDAVALDIEALAVRSTTLRTARLLDLLRQLRSAAGEIPVAAITYPPRMLERHASWWPAFPWAEIAPLVDAFIPMAYTGGAFTGYDTTYGYVARSLKLLRRAIGPDVALHVAGGVPSRMGPEELKAFADAVVDDGTATGWSLYDLATTTAAAWTAIARLDAAAQAPGQQG